MESATLEITMIEMPREEVDTHLIGMGMDMLQ